MNLYIFDCFGVLISEVAPYFFRNHFDEETAARLKEEYFRPADLGKITLDETLDKMSNLVHMTRADVEKEYFSYVHIYDDVFNYILELRKNNKTALLSNAPIDFFNVHVPIDFDKYFDKVFISAEVKMAKPDLKFYNYAVDQFTEKFDNIIFTDDNINNIKVLEGTRIKGILYKSLDDFKKQIENL